MAVQSFEELDVWREAEKLTVACYRYFKSTADFAFRQQIERACVSVMNNVAEGFERLSNQDFKRFLYIAKGSSGEVRSMLHLALELGYLPKADFELVLEQSTRVSKMLSGLIKSLP